MTCERIRQQIPECLAGRLEAGARERVIDHLETCAACRADMAELGAVWRGLEAMAEAEPSQAMRARFVEMLAAYQEGYEEAQRRQAYAGPAAVRGWRMWQMAAAAALLLAGLGLGRYALAPRNAANPEIAQLEGQVENLRQLVTLSLLQEQSPSSRLRGVTYSYQISQPDEQVEQALLHAVSHDSNVNVRLSAVDALRKYTASVDVRRALADAIPVQESPLVQIALIDLLVEVNDRDAAGALGKLARDNSADEAVRQRAAAGLARLGVTQ